MNIKTIKNEDFPQELQEINDSPKLLYYRGNLETLEASPKVAVVGTRRCSDYGKEATRKITGELAKAGIPIISGMARGIDTIAHETALEYGAPTIAVLGSPVNDKDIYPKRNAKLARRIEEAGGIVVSEYPEGSPSYPGNFPARNRIVAGLSQGVLLSESPVKGGSMITARLALEYNRNLYAVPGSIFSRLSEGCNFWISRGAKSIQDGKEILQELELNYKINFETRSEEKLDEKEKEVYKLISESPEPLHVDNIAKAVKMSAEEISEIVSRLMLEEYIKESEPNHYIIFNDQ